MKGELRRVRNWIGESEVSREVEVKFQEEVRKYVEVCWEREC